jgi:hypothetical protein
MSDYSQNVQNLVNLQQVCGSVDAGRCGFNSKQRGPGQMIRVLMQKQSDNWLSFASNHTSYITFTMQPWFSNLGKAPDKGGAEALFL